MKHKNSWMIGGLLMMAAAANAQQGNKLTVEDAVATAVAGNTAVKIAAFDQQLAAQKYKQSEAMYLPQVNFSYTAFSTNNPLNAFGFKLQQKSITAADFNPALLNNPKAQPDFTTKIELQQPLLNMDMTYQRKAAAMQIEASKLGLQRTTEYIAFETRKVYLQLQMQYAAQKVLLEAQQVAKAVYKNVQDYYKQGLVQKSDLLNAEVHLNGIETEIHRSQSAINDLSDMLSLLMAKPSGTVYSVDSLLMNTTDTATLQYAAGRSDFKAMQKGVEAYNLMIKSSKMSRLPRVNAFGSWQLNDSRMLGFGANAWMAGIQLSWNLFDGNRTKHNIAQQQTERDRLQQQLQQQQEQSQLQIIHAKRELEDAAFAARQQQLSVQQSSEALRVLQNRFAQGLVKTSDVLMAQVQLSQQQLAFVQTQFNYNMGVLTLQLLTQSK